MRRQLKNVEIGKIKGATMDSVKPTDRESSQQTAKGFEIGVPTDEQFFGDLRKASRKIEPKPKASS